MTAIPTENKLTPNLEFKLSQLFQICRQEGSYCPSYPKDGDIFFALKKSESDSSLAAALILFHLEEDLWEVAALTHPDFRRQGCFRCLLDAAEAFSPNADFVFAVPPKTEPAASVLDSIGAQFWYTEHLMALDSSNMPIFPCKIPDSLSCCIQWPDGCSTAAGMDISACFYSGQTLTASCRLNFSACTEGPVCCIYQVLVPETLRHQGWGFRFFAALLPLLAQKGVLRFVLQVSGDNLPALALYKKTGFRITETLWYYLY